MNICNIYRTVLIYLLLCYGKKFINGDGIQEDRQNSPELSSTGGTTQQTAAAAQEITTNLNPTNLNSNNNDNIDLVQAQLGALPTQQAPAPLQASQAPAKAQGHQDISLDSPSDTDGEDIPLSVKRKLMQKTAPEQPTSGSEIELDVDLDAKAKQKLAQTTTHQQAAPTQAGGGVRTSNTVQGHPDLVILDLSEKYSTDKVNYEYKAAEQSHFFKPIPPNKFYHVKLGDTTAWQFSGTGDHPLEVRVVPDTEGNPKLQILFPQYVETETESEFEAAAPKQVEGQPPRVMPRPGEAAQQPTQPQPVAQPQQTVQLPPQVPQPQPQPAPPQQQAQPPPHRPAYSPGPPEGAAPLPDHTMTQAPGYRAPQPRTMPELISVDIKNFQSTNQVDYFYYDREKIHKFLCKPQYLIGVLFKDGKIKKHFTQNFPNRVLIIRDPTGAPILRVLEPNDYDPNEPRYIPEQYMSMSMMPGQYMGEQRMMDLRMMDPRFMRPQMPRPIPVEINTDRKMDTKQYTYELKAPHTHLFTARKPCLFASIRNNRKVLMTADPNKMPDRVLYKDLPGSKPQLRVAYPEKPPMLPPPHMRPPMMPPMHPGMRRPGMPYGPPPPRLGPGPPVKVTEEVAKPGPRLHLVSVDINYRANTDQVLFSYDPDEQSFVFTAQAPYYISQALAGREVLWVAKQGKYAEEVRATYDAAGTPNLRVFLHEPDLQTPQARLPRPPEPRPMVPGVMPHLPPAEPTIQLVELDVAFFHSTNEILYRFYPQYGVHKFLCRPGYMISRVVKNGRLKQEFAADYPNRVLIMMDPYGGRVLRLLGPNDVEPYEPVDPELDKFFTPYRELVPTVPGVPGVPAVPELEYEVPYPEAMPVRPEVPEEEMPAEYPEEAEVAEEEVPEEHVPAKPTVDYATLVGTQLYIYTNNATDKFFYQKERYTGTHTYTVKGKYAFSSVKTPKTFSKPEVIVWKADECEEFAKKVTHTEYGVDEMEEINIYLYDGTQKKFVRRKNVTWKEIDLNKDNVIDMDINADKCTYMFRRFPRGHYVEYLVNKPYLIGAIYKMSIGVKMTLWDTNNPDYYVKRVERDGHGALATLNNFTLFFINGKIKHVTKIKDKGIEKWRYRSPHIHLDLRENSSNLYYNYTEENGFGTFAARNNITFITVSLGKCNTRVNSFVFSKTPYGKFCTRVITNIHFASQRTKFVSVLFNDGKHTHFVSPIHSKQWQRIPLEVELSIQKRTGQYQYRYLPDDQLPSYITNFNFVISRIIQNRTLIWSTRDKVGAVIVIMDETHDPKRLAVFLSDGRTIFFRKSGIFWSKYDKFLPLHLEIEHRKTTSCIIYKYDKENKLEIYTPRNGLFIKSVSNQHRHIWTTDNENEYARRVVLSEDKLTIFQSDRKRLEFDRDLAYDEYDYMNVIDPQYGFHA